MMVEHHIKYKEIHGYDETIWITKSEHNKINHRILFPEVSKEELKKISHMAQERTTKRRKYKRIYSKNNCEKYYENNKEKFKFPKKFFNLYMMPNVKYNESIGYNKNTNNILIHCGFQTYHGKKLFYIDID